MKGTPRRDLLILLAKAPVVGGVKTRMEPALSREGALELHRCLLSDTLRLPATLPGVTFEVHTPTPEHPFWDPYRGRFPIRAQGEGDLGRRMAHAFSLGLASHERVVVIGSDAPTLPPAHLSAAFDALRRRKVVIGPARDGGYYLIGLRGEIPPIFEGIAWGSASVLADTLERLPPRQTHLLPFWFDVDTPDDLRLLAAYLPFLLEEHPDTLPHTRAFLSRIMGTRSER